MVEPVPLPLPEIVYSATADKLAGALHQRILGAMRGQGATWADVLDALACVASGYCVSRERSRGPLVEAEVFAAKVRRSVEEHLRLNPQHREGRR